MQMQFTTNSRTRQSVVNLRGHCSNCNVWPLRPNVMLLWQAKVIRFCGAVPANPEVRWALTNQGNFLPARHMQFETCNLTVQKLLIF